MAATSPRGGGGGCGGYSSRASDRRRAAHRRAPGPSAMFRQTSLGPASRLPSAPPATRSGSHREPRSPAAPGGHAAVRAPPGAASAPPAGRALRPPRPPPRRDPRAPASQGLRALPGPGRLRLAHFPGAISQHRLGNAWKFGLTVNKMLPRRCPSGFLVVTHLHISNRSINILNLFSFVCSMFYSADIY
ncbi:serine/arginine repetitive matrix protein 1-like isoform X1 [Cervus elaphus]|uniref:serine/arginine repetitive matrix protein 1-like isoform X1 n=1 Tax=Cervus canadensis TaxID=1574408 RepID=UPI001CA363F8|nr:serine/arginine repetitive matrix protein 1-like isoform X1 [Cervus canadensis]XP_043783673.1 serine/arginine repetitive matrix protein 1-like isoform X1 [Cervus elaphus]